MSAVIRCNELYAHPNALLHLYNVTVRPTEPLEHNRGMEWTQVILDLRSRKLTLQEIGDMVGMSKGGVHDLMTGRGKTVVYDTGIRLMELHRKVMRRKS